MYFETGMYFQPDLQTIIPSQAALEAIYGFKWPSRPTAEALVDLTPTVVLLMRTARPAAPEGQKVVQQAVPTQEGALWVLGWDLVPMTEAEILAALPYQTAEEARLAMVGWIDRLTRQILAQYPEAVRERWPKEEAAARAYDDGNASPAQTVLIEREAAAKGKTPADHAARVVELADKYSDIADQINTLMLATTKALEDAASPVEYPGILDAAIAQAGPLAAAYDLEVEGE